MFIASNFSIEYLENKQIKGWTIVARYNGSIVGATDVSMDTEVYKNICVCSYLIGTCSEVEREEIFKHFFFLFCHEESLPVYFNASQLSDIDKKYLLDLGAEEMVDEKHETMWFKEDPVVLKMDVLHEARH